MSDEQKAHEGEVFDQALSMDELDAVAGGGTAPCSRMTADGDNWDSNWANCVSDHYKHIYGGGGFPNCAATVEDGSLCHKNDACKMFAVVYEDIRGDQSDNCSKAWH